MRISRRIFIAILSCIGLAPKNLPGKIEIKETTNFLIPCEDDEGNTIYELNVFGDYYKLIATYKEINSENIYKSLWLRFESKKIFVNKPSEEDKLDFQNKCFVAFSRSKLKSITEVANKILII